MKKTWSIINSLKVNKKIKNNLFIWWNVIILALVGAALWGVIGRLFLPGIIWLVCFIGYPAMFIGLLGSVLYLYNHEFA